MKSFLRSFALLWLPSLAVLLCGLFPLLRTGQVDPRGWSLPALLLIPAAALLTARRGVGEACWASLGAFGAALCCVFLAAGGVPALAPTLWLAAGVLLATVAGVVLSGRNFAGARWWLGGGLTILAVTVTGLARAPRIEPAPGDRPQLAVVSSLPLFWKDVASGPAARVDAPIVTVLRQRFDVLPLDSPLSLGAARAKRLLLAQPRALSIEELLALDSWVRRGGQATILADPQLHWPMVLPLGDRRRPPSVTLLDGLIGHWGIGLAPVISGEQRHFLPDGRMLTLYASSSFRGLGPACHVTGRGVIARCKVGKGMATIVADADLIDDRLWLADPTAPLDTSRWSADTPQFIAETLGADDLPAPRNWVRSGAALVGAVRWAILLGIFWAALGATPFRGRVLSSLGLFEAALGHTRRKKKA